MKNESRRPVTLVGAAAAFALSSLITLAQGPPPMSVRTTEAREQSVRQSVRLPGTLASPETSLVASEVAGLVEHLMVREGDAVEKGAPLAELRRRPKELEFDASAAELAEARARARLAAQTLERIRDLREGAVASQADLDDALAEHAAWEGRVARLSAQIAQLEEDLERMVIRAPFRGVVTSKQTEAGEWVGVGGTVFELVAVDRLEALVAVPERYFGGLRRDMPARVRLDALGGLVVEGRVSALIPRADPSTRTFTVKVLLENSERRLGVGMLAEVEMPLGEMRTVTMVPKDAVSDVVDGRRGTLYVVAEDGTVARQQVTLGVADGAWLAVEGAVAPGDTVVVRGNERLRPGMKVDAQPLARVAR